MPDQALPQHPNGMRLFAADAHGRTLADLTMFSIGGGFIVDAKDFPAGPQPVAPPWPLPYRSGAELLQLCAQEGCSIAELALRNELALRSRDEVIRGLDDIRRAMFECMDRGLRQEGVLPGVLKVRRRAPALFQALQRGTGNRPPDDGARLGERVRGGRQRGERRRRSGGDRAHQRGRGDHPGGAALLRAVLQRRPAARPAATSC